MISNIAAIATVVAGVYSLLHILLHLTQSPKEPPTIGNAIPFITPIVGMKTLKAKFYEVMRNKYNLPIYTLRLPGARLYVVNSITLIPVVQRQFRTLSFTAIEAAVAKNVIGVCEATDNIISSNLTDDDGYLMSFSRYIHPMLNAGSPLDSMNRRAVQVISESLEKWAKGGPTTVDMFHWIRHELVSATTESVYGPQNPFRDPRMEKAWYKFEPNIFIFILNVFPWLLAREAFQAREYMITLWERYFDQGGHKEGSGLVQARVKINEDFHIPIKETARVELGGVLAILANTVPSAFWVIYHIFSDPLVLEDIRAELSNGVREIDGVCTIDMVHVKESCPILLSVFQEMLRVNGTAISARIAQEDVMLDNKYLIKKGSTVLIPSSIQHTDPSIWGENVNEFYHKRFVREPGVKRPNPIAFRGFGGGTTLCPGRHFATTEALLFSALMALRFDVTPVGGKWVHPTTENSPLFPAIPVPDSVIDIEIRPRNNMKWNVSFSKSDMDLEISAEDIEGIAPKLSH
ncbi:cytochrome P450 [Annulohypoxylon maeteangense]|uniref:cytochrome P450 n=1 Tax=Annulohypoxylon maeteangense TaxID=1927788 RepID=UPI00200837B0|nr:cytochrome P450 [Annulohypoxylon maeteangense]KAI0886561.1 cytochrome P450 [Annulohypoxylon maeteangense]